LLTTGLSALVIHPFRFQPTSSGTNVMISKLFSLKNGVLHKMLLICAKNPWRRGLVVSSPPAEFWVVRSNLAGV
jgi:hypothetical protein